MANENKSEEERLLSEIEYILKYRLTRYGVNAAKRNEEELARWRLFAAHELSTYLRMEHAFKKVLLRAAASDAGEKPKGVSK